MNEYCMYCMNPIKDSQSECPFCGKRKIEKIPAHHILPGTVLNGKYTVGGILGEGGFGITYIGRDTTLDIKVAVKEFYPNGCVTRNNTVSKRVDVIDSDDSRSIFTQGKEKFLLEARTLAKLTGEPGIVAVRDFFEENNTAYIVMEYLDGITLQKYIDNNGRLSVKQTLDFMTPVMQSLKKIHLQGLIHRDVSPDNIMIVGENVKLLDFGAARSYGESMGHSILLKPGYAPEEQYRSKGEQGPWSDVYAICAVMYKCITGITPDDSNQRVYYDELKKPSDLGVEIDKAVEMALMKGLAVSHHDRYKSIDELINGLNGLDNAPVKNLDTQRTAYADVPQSEYIPTAAAPYAPPVQGTVQLAKDNGQSTVPQANAVFYPPQNQANTVNPLPQNTYNSYNSAQPQQPVSTPVKKAKNNYKIGIIAAIIIVVAALVVGAAALNTTPSAFTIGDSEINIEDTAVYVYNDNITAKDMKYLSKMKNLETVSFTTCTFEKSSFESIEKLSDGLTWLSLNDCTGVTELSEISKLENIEWLVLRNCGITDEMLADIDFSKLDNLGYIDLSYNAELSDISPLEGLDQLFDTLCVDYTGVRDFSAISQLSGNYLSAVGNGIDDLSAILCQDLFTLDLSDNEISDLSLLTTLPTVQNLYLANNKISDITPIGQCEGLTYMDLSGNNISDISPLASCTELYSVNLSNNKITSLESLSDCKELTSIDVSGNELTNLDGLEQSIELSSLYAKDNKISDIQGLSNCTVLTDVGLQNNNITDISVLSKSASALKILYLSGNAISDISPLKSTTELTNLTLDNNKLTDLDAISGNINLNTISAENNEIKSIEGLSSCHALKYISLADNQIEDMTPISGLVPSDMIDYALIDLHGNNISKINLSSEKEYDALCLYDNAITDYTPLQNIVTDYVYIDYNESTDWTSFNNGSFVRYCIVDCPLDKQLQIEEDMGYDSIVEFYTKEEADEEVKKTKSLAVSDGSDTDTEDTEYDTELDD